MGGSRLLGHYAQEDARFRRRPPETAVAEALVCAKVFFFRVLRARARNGRFETGRTLRARRRKVSAPPPRNGRRRSPCVRESLFFSRFCARARAMGGSRLVGHYAQEDARFRRRPPETAVAEALVCAKVLFFFAFCARARNGRFETGRTLRARRRKVSAAPPRNGRRRGPCLRESLFFSRFPRARAQWEVRDWSDITRKKTQGFGGAPPKRPSQKPLSARESFFSGGSARAKPRNCKIVAEPSASDRGYLVVQLACRLISLHKTPEKSPAFYF